MGLTFTPHPILKAPTPAQIVKLSKTKAGQEALLKWHTSYHAKLKLAEEDPLNHGFELPQWKDADKLFEEFDIVLVLGGNRSSKTEYGGRTSIKALLENPNSDILSFAQDHAASVRVQQKAAYRYLPPEYKKKTKDAVAYLNYTLKNGFTGESFILDNSSQNFFHAYSQFTANRAKFEGLEIGSKESKWINLGFLFDEYLEDGDCFNTMKYRLITRNAKGLMVFTPIDGHTPFVASCLQGAVTVKTRPAELLGGEEVPYIQHNYEKNIGIIYFHTDMNPFNDYERLKKDLRGASRDEILTRAYGIPVKSMTTLFPLFNSNVHVVDDIPADVGDKKKWTVYHVVDPASARNYVAIWAAVNAKGEVCVLREWPDRETYGPWAEFGDPKWKFGPASKKMGYNVKGYVDLFKEIEHELGVEPFERIGDSRFFAAENEDNVDLFTAFSEAGMDFIPSDGRHEDMGIAKLDEYFHYNPNVEIDEANKPLMTIHKDCGNTIYSIMNYGQNGKKDEPLKDFIDAPRYLAMSNAGEGPEHYPPEAFKQESETGGY